MMKKLLFVITLILLFVAYSSVHDLISNSAFGMLDPATQQYTRVDHGWNAVLAAWPIALAGALILALPASLGLAALYMHASAVDNRALMKKVDDQIANARAAVASAREDAERAVESRTQAALHSQRHAENLIMQAEQIKDEAAKQIIEMTEKIADINGRQCRAAESFNRIKRKNQQLEAAITAMNSASAGQALKGGVSENGK